MNGKTYRVLKELLNTKDGYISASDIAFSVNMTGKQVQSIISMLNLPIICRVYDENMHCTRLKLEATPEERRRIFIEATVEYYGLSDETINKVRNSLSPVGWMSVSDIVEDTQLESLEVVKALAVMDNIMIKERGSSVFYRIPEQVL